MFRQIAYSLIAVVVLSAFHGSLMGASSSGLQMLFSALKVPLLYLLTLLVCFPVLYVINVVMGSRLSFPQTAAMILLAMALNAVLLASCAPIVLFFTITGARYDFLKLLQVAVFGFSGLWAMFALYRGLLAMCERSALYPRQALRILQVWIVVFAFVGMQMAWSLRPFVGSPNLEFQVFREQGGNIYQAVADSARNLVSPKAAPGGTEKNSGARNDDRQ